MHGEIFVEEAANWGSAAMANPLMQSGGLAAPSSPGSKHAPRVLVADANADMREYIARLLHGRYQLLTAQNGTEALALAQRERPDPILSDVMMPGVDGFALLQAIRRLENSFSHSPIGPRRPGSARRWD
jgi:PleD family two-component response regulator